MTSTTAAVDVDPYVPGHGDLAYDVTAYDLDLVYRVTSNHLDARAELHVLTRRAVDRLALDLAGLKVRKVVVDGQRPAAFTQRGNRLHIRLSSPAVAGARLRLRIRYDGNPTPIGSPWGEVGWEELDDGVIVAGQPSGAPSWFPCNDRCTNKATYRTTITTASEYAVVANGVLTERRVAGSRTTWVYEQRQPMATYLATVQVGRYVSRDIHGPVPVRLFRPSHLAARADSDFGRQGQMLSVFTEVFGPYPFDNYAVVVTEDDLEIPLEAQGLSVFGANHIDGNRTQERLVAHELAHQWFGNSLTAGAWSDIWLHEGFACYAEWLWSERSGGDSAERLARRHHAVLAARPSDVVLADPGREHMFDDLVYKRGALTLHALRRHLGDERFFAMLRGWVAQNRYGTVTTGSFLQHWCADPATFDMVEAWLRRPALPDLACGR